MWDEFIYIYILNAQNFICGSEFNGFIGNKEHVLCPWLSIITTNVLSLPRVLPQGIRHATHYNRGYLNIMLWLSGALLWTITYLLMFKWQLQNCWYCPGDFENLVSWLRIGSTWRSMITVSKHCWSTRSETTANHKHGLPHAKRFILWTWNCHTRLQRWGYMIDKPLETDQRIYQGQIIWRSCNGKSSIRNRSFSRQHNSWKSI